MTGKSTDPTNQISQEEQDEIYELQMKLYNTHHVVEGCGKCLQTSCSCQIKERCWIKNGKFSIFRVRVLPLKPDKEPVMCSYYKQKRCSNPNCSYAHGEEELYIWKGTLEIRDAVLSPRHPISQPQFSPVYCSFMMKDGACKNGKNCKFPHSKKELNNWELSYEPLKKEFDEDISKIKSDLYKTHKLQEVCSTCYNDVNHSVVVLKPATGITTCPNHNGAWDGIKIYPAPIRSAPSDAVLQKCNFPTTCQNGDDCKRPHSEFELIVWEDEKEAERAVRNPRKEPPEMRNPRMCKYMEKTGRCDFRVTCKFAHSQQELKLWKSLVQNIKEKIPKLMKESKNQTLREISEDKGITDRTIKLALDILIAEETTKHNVQTDFPLNEEEQIRIIYHRHAFLDQMARFLNVIVFKTSLLKEQFKEDSDEDHQEMDSRKLLDVIRRKIKDLRIKDSFSNTVFENESLIYMYATLLQGMCHRIAHQCYLVVEYQDYDNDDEEVISPHLISTRGFVETFFEYGIQFAKELAYIKQTEIGNPKEFCASQVKKLEQISQKFNNHTST